MTVTPTPPRLAAWNKVIYAEPQDLPALIQQLQLRVRQIAFRWTIRMLLRIAHNTLVKINLNPTKTRCYCQGK